jgi:GAF domain-containing protein
LLLGEPVWWCTSGAHSEIRILQSHGKRECGLLHDDSEIRERWMKEANAAIDRVAEERVGAIASSPPDCVQVVVPVFCGREIQGFIGIAHLPEYEEKRLSPLLPLMVDHIRNTAEGKRADEDLKGVRRLWKDVVSTLDLDVLEDRILGEIMAMLDTNTGALLLTDARGRLVPRNSIGLENQAESMENFYISATPYENKMSSWTHAAQILSPGDPLRQWFLSISLPVDEGSGVWAVPLTDSGKLFGLALCPGKEGSTLEPHLDMALETLALGSSVAIRNAQEFEQMRQKAVALSTVHSVYRMMSTTRDMGDLLKRMANLTIQVLNVRKCSIMLVDKNGTLQPHVRIGLEPGEIGTVPLEMDQAIPGKVAASAASVMVDGPLGDPRYADDPSEFYPSQSYLSVPLFEEDVVGVITVADRIGTPSRFVEGDREVLNTLAEQAVIALLNIQFFEKQERIALRTMETFENLYETGDPDTEGHAQTLARLVDGLAEHLKIDPLTRQAFRMAAFVDSVSNLVSGSNHVSFATEESAVSERLKLSARIAARLDLPDKVVPILKSLLEHFDGSGEPRGLRGEEIPLGARLLSVADGYLGLIRIGGLTASQALSRMAEESGRLYDPHLVESIREYLRPLDDGPSE